MADTQEPQGTPPAAPDLAPHEAQEQDDSFFGGGAQPTGGDPVSSKSLSDLVTGGSGTQAPPTPQGNPLARWLKNIARGPADATNQLAKTGAQMLAKVGRAEAKVLRSRAVTSFTRKVPVIGEDLSIAREMLADEVDVSPEQADKVQYASEEEISTVYGPKPHDLVGGLLHGISQWGSGSVMLTPIVGPGVAMFASGGAAFDPKEGGIANVALQHEATLRKLPVAGAVVANVAHVLDTTDPDLGPLEARFWNAVQGEVFGRTTLFLLRPFIKIAARALGKTPPVPALHTVDVAEAVPGSNGQTIVRPAQEFASPLELNGGRPTANVESFQADLDQAFGKERTLRGTDRRVSNTPVQAERRARVTTAGDDLPIAQSEDRLRDTQKLLDADKALADNEGSIGKAADALAAKAAGQPLVKIEVVSKGSGVAEIRNIESLVPGKGHGSEAMRKIIAAADKRGVTLTLEALPKGDAAMSPNVLRDFYRRFGFEQVQAGEAQMVRRPNTAPTEFREGSIPAPKEVPRNTVEVMKEIKANGLEARVREEAAQRGGEAADVEHAARTVLHEHYNQSSLKASPNGGPRAVYSDAAAANSDAATINAVAYEEARAASMFTPEEVALHRTAVEAVRAGEVSAMSNGKPYFNLQSMGTSEAVDEQINALTHVYGDLFSVAQGRPSVPNDVLHDAARLWAGEVHLDNFIPAMKAADASGQLNLSIRAALYNAATKQAGQEVAELGALMAAKPGDEALELLARRRLETFLRVSEATANFNTELGRGLQALSARGDASAAAIRFGSGVEVRPSIMAPRTVSPKLPFDTQRLSPAQLGSMVRLFARSGGDVRVLAHVREALRQSTEQNKINWQNLSEFNKNVNQLSSLFINSIISGFKTMQTIAFSGATLNAYHASMKVLTGAHNANGAMVEEGLGQWYALVRYSRQNMRGAWAAFKENRGILEATPAYSVDPSAVMKGVQVPGRVAGSLDEFTRETAYRAEEFAAAFRQARNEGLPIRDAIRRAEYDVSQSIDKATGIGLNNATLKRAGVPTLSDNPGMDSFVGRAANLLAEYPATKFAVPFVRPSVNTFRYAHMNTPLLNRWSKDAQAIYQAGGEAATILHTQVVATGSMMVYAMSKYMDGEITGAGPKDPKLRAMMPAGWQPYAVKIGGKYHSYRRAEPFATFLGLVADTFEIFHEIPEEDRDETFEKVQGVMTSVLAAATRNTTSKSWTESLYNFLAAMDDRDDNSMRKYLVGLSRGLIPYGAALKQFVDDPAWREVRSALDAVKANIPGWSETLPARYGWDGKVSARQGDMWNRNFSTSYETDAPPEGNVDDVLVDNYIRLAPPNPRPYKGIDMWDERWRNAAGKLPYEVFMEKLAATNVRKLVEDRVKNKSFTEAPQGTVSYPDSYRADQVRQIVGAQQERALFQMLSEFQGKGGFAAAYYRAKYVLPYKAKYQGPDAANAEKELYGIPTNIRR
jgi:hypothetical protein